VAVDESQVEQIVREVVNNLFASVGTSTLKTVPVSSSTGDGIFESIEDAIKAAKDAQKKYVELGRDIRFKIVDAIRQAALANKERLAKMGVEETKMGRYEDKIVKNEIAALFTPGPEYLVQRWVLKKPKWAGMRIK